MGKYEMFKRAVWFMTIIWMAVIFYFSSQPANVSRVQSGMILVKINMLSEEETGIVGNSRISDLQNIVRKSAHFIEYCILGTLVALSVILLEWDIGIVKLSFMSWGVCTLYAISDELHQSFVPGRGAMVKDVILDSSASLVGIVIISLFFVMNRENLNFFKGRNEVI